MFRIGFLISISALFLIIAGCPESGRFGNGGSGGFNGGPYFNPYEDQTQIALKIISRLRQEIGDGSLESIKLANIPEPTPVVRATAAQRQAMKAAILATITTNNKAAIAQQINQKPDLFFEDWQEIKQALLKKKHLGHLELVIDEAHLERAQLNDPLSKFKEPLLTPDEAMIVGNYMFSSVNFTDAALPGYVKPENRREDGRKRDPDELRTLFTGFVGKVFHGLLPEQSAKKIRIILYRLTDPNFDIVSRNYTIVDMALSNTHCSTRAQDQLNQSMNLVTGETSEAFGATFEKRLERSLIEWRKWLANAIFNQAGSTEVSHGRAYWLQFLGEKIGIPDNPPIPNFPFYTEGWLGPNYNLEKNRAIHMFFGKNDPSLGSLLYPSKKNLTYIPKHLIGQLEFLLVKDKEPDTRIKMPLFSAWLTAQGLHQQEGDFMALDDVNFAPEKFEPDAGEKIFFRLGGYLTYRFNPAP